MSIFSNRQRPVDLLEAAAVQGIFLDRVSLRVITHGDQRRVEFPVDVRFTLTIAPALGLLLSRTSQGSPRRISPFNCRCTGQCRNSSPKSANEKSDPARGMDASSAAKGAGLGKGADADAAFA